MKHLSNLHAEGEQLLTPFFNLADEGIHKYTFFILSIHKSHLYLKIKDADSGHQFVKDMWWLAKVASPDLTLLGIVSCSFFKTKLQNANG